MPTKKTPTKPAPAKPAAPAKPTAPTGALAVGAAVVLEDVRYVVEAITGTGDGAVATLVSPDGSHDAVTQCRASELVHHATFGVWTLPGRLVKRDQPASGAVMASDARGHTTVGPLRRVESTPSRT